MKTATNIYIFNLALADALATSTLPFQSVNYLLGTWPFGTTICKIVISIDYYNMFTSIFTLCTMSVDRYIAVCHPVKALDFRTPRNAKIVNVCNWIVSSAIGIPVMIMATTKESNVTDQLIIQQQEIRKTGKQAKAIKSLLMKDDNLINIGKEGTAK
ncbi:UNVERIFIED_CONTAM: Mu-type opioid receptor, partial [Gekko kuhli]